MLADDESLKVRALAEVVRLMCDLPGTPETVKGYLRKAKRGF